jgi:hypothetical protein
MSVTFDVFRIAQDGQQELVCTTQSARAARELRDSDPGELLVVVRDDGIAGDNDRAQGMDIDARGDVDGDFPI